MVCIEDLEPTSLSDLSLKTVQRGERHRHCSCSKNSLVFWIKCLFFLSPSLGDQLPKQTGAVKNAINMIDGISGVADLTPCARVQGAGAAQIYSLQPPHTHPPPNLMISSSLTHRCWALLRLYHTAESSGSFTAYTVSLINILAHVQHDYTWKMSTTKPAVISLIIKLSVMTDIYYSHPYQK